MDGIAKWQEYTADTNDYLLGQSDSSRSDKITILKPYPYRHNKPSLDHCVCIQQQILWKFRCSWQWILRLHSPYMWCHIFWQMVRIVLEWFCSSKTLTRIHLTASCLQTVHKFLSFQSYRGADKPLAQPGRKQLQRQRILIFIYPIYNHNQRNISTICIQGVPRVKVTTSGECSLCWTIPI